MTSPQAETIDLVHAMATSTIHHVPPGELTANTDNATDSPERLISHSATTNIAGQQTIDFGASTDEGANGLAEEAVPEPAVPATLELEQSNLFPPVSMADFAQMNALTAMNYAQGGSNFTLGMGMPGVAQLGMEGLPLEIPGDNYMGSVHPPIDEPFVHDVDATRISAYAKLEFEDGEFYMNTYQVVLGRDLAAARAASRRDAEEEEVQKEEDEPALGDPKTPIRIKREESRYSKSIISESGGILREGDDSDKGERVRKRKSHKASKKSKSTQSSSQRESGRNPTNHVEGKVQYEVQSQVRRRAPDTAGAVPVDPASLRPSPHDCPLVGIHPPASTPASGYKAISRKHVKIAFNPKKHIFEAQIIGRNGAFIDDDFYYHKDVIPLKSGSRLQIGGVVVNFVLPDVAIGETGAAEQMAHDNNSLSDQILDCGKEMSFDFEDEPRGGVVLEDSSDEGEGEEVDQFEQDDIGEEGREEDDLNIAEEDDEDEGEEEEEEEEPGEDDEEEVGDSGQSDLADAEGDEDEEEHPQVETIEAPDPLPQPVKKRGPGRPPKNGIMSKREQQLLKREEMAKAQKTVPDGSGKNKVGRPRKNPLEGTPPLKTEKRKYTKRKNKDPNSPSYVKEEGSPGEDGISKEKKEKKPSKPPRSPSPVFNEADLTPEQMAKPQANYVTLIHEALSNSPTGQMSLPQIYRAIQRRYPFFVLKCNTNGWQSSVRHNLSQHHAFRKVERDGKGWMWAIVDGVSIEKEKKRRMTPPPQMGPPHPHHQQMYRTGPPPHHMMMGPPPGYPMNMQYQPHHGLPLPFPGGPQPMMHHLQPHPHGTNGGPPMPPYPLPLGPPLQPPGQNGNTYSSPYAPKPPNPPPPSQPPNVQGPPHILSQPQPQGPQGQQPQLSLTQQPQIPGASQQVMATPPSQHVLPKANDNVMRAVNAFKTALIVSLRGKSNNAEAVVASAVNRVLGIATQSTVPGDPHEEKIMDALRSMIGKIPGASIPRASQGVQVSQAGGTPNQPQQRAALQQTQNQPMPPGSRYQIGPGPHNGPSPSQPSSLPQTAAPHLAVAAPKTPTPVVSAPTVMRPTFSGQAQARPGMGPRPPMMTPGMTRTNSGSPANAPPPRQSSVSSVSATVPPPTNGMSTPKLAPADISTPGSGSGSGSGSVPAITVPNGMANANANGSASTNAMSSLSASINRQGEPKGSGGVQPCDLASTSAPAINLKRPLEDPDEMPEFKRIATSGPPPLKI